MKRIIHSELAYMLGILTLALGTALMTFSDFGVSIVVAPAYLVYRKLSSSLPFFTFGMSEYLLQALLLVLLILVLRKYKRFYLFSFVTAVIYGVCLDFAMSLVSFFSFRHIIVRIALYFIGMLLCALGVSFMFHTYIAPEVYELVVKELSSHYNIDIHRFKLGYDYASCGISIVLSFCFFGFGVFEGIKYGSILTALINGRLIGACSNVLEKTFMFKDGLKLRKYFE